MRHATAILLIVLAPAAAPGLARAQATPADSAAVVATISRFHDALTRGDSAAALALLADDAVILESGGVESRTEYRGHHLPADIRFALAVPATRGPVAVTLAGDVAWAASTSEVAGTFNNRPVNSSGAELVVLTRTGEGWKIRAIHWSSRRRAGQ